MTPRHFLNVKSYSDWQAEQANDLVYLNVFESDEHFAASLCRGDNVITYVKGKGFIDVRCVTRELFSSCVLSTGASVSSIETKPIAVIHSENRIVPERIADRLTFADKNDHWKTAQKALHLLTQEDGLMLVSLIIAVAKVERVATRFEHSTRTQLESARA